MTKEVDEKHFVQGMSSGKAGLPEDSCPYPWKNESDTIVDSSFTAPVNWREGWKFGTFLVTQTLRKEKYAEIMQAMEYMLQFQNEYTEMCQLEKNGIFRSGLKYFSAKRRSNEIARQLRGSKEHQLLQAAKIELYIPWRPDEAPYTFRFFDRIDEIFWHSNLGTEHFRKLVSRFGEKHGVLASWNEYLEADTIETVLSEIKSRRNQVSAEVKKTETINPVQN